MNVEDLFYPDVIEITSQEQMDKIKKYKTNIYNYMPGKSAYLFGKTNTSDGNGIADSLKAYDESYNKYKFSDIVFPDEEIIFSLY